MLGAEQTFDAQVEEESCETVGSANTTHLVRVPVAGVWGSREALFHAVPPSQTPVNEVQTGDEKRTINRARFLTGPAARSCRTDCLCFLFHGAGACPSTLLGVCTEKKQEQQRQEEEEQDQP